MLSDETRSRLGEIFHEGLVCDLDFSEWYRRVRVVVGAGAIESMFSRRYCAHFNVDFVNVRSVHFDCADHDLPYVNWVVFDWTCGLEDGDCLVTLHRCGGLEPELAVRCRSVEIEEIDPSRFDRVNPDWAAPGNPLARPSLEWLCGKLG